MDPFLRMNGGWDAFQDGYGEGIVGYLSGYDNISDFMPRDVVLRYVAQVEILYGHPCRHKFTYKVPIK